MVNTIWFRFDSIRFWKDFAAYTWAKLTAVMFGVIVLKIFTGDKSIILTDDQSVTTFSVCMKFNDDSLLINGTQKSW